MISAHGPRLLSSKMTRPRLIFKTRPNRFGCICFVAHEGIEALSIIERERRAWCYFDLMLPKLAGDQILKNFAVPTEWEVRRQSVGHPNPQTS